MVSEMKNKISVILILCLLTSFLPACSISQDQLHDNLESVDVPEAQLLFWDNSEEDTIYDENTDDETLDRLIATLLSEKYIVDELIIKFKNPSEVEDKEQLEQEIAKFEYTGYIQALDLYVIKVQDIANNPEVSLAMYIKQLIKNTYIEYVEPNYISTLNLIPNDPNYKNQSVAFKAVNAEIGWDITTGNGSPVVAFIDTGMSSHPDLPSPKNIYSAVVGLNPTVDSLGHGTQVAGVYGMIGNSNSGGAGINWNANIFTVKVDDAKNLIAVSNVAKGITWAVDNGARIISISIACSDSITLKSAIDYAFNKGCVIVAGSGNDGKLGVVYPAAYNNVLGVGASSNGTTRLSYSNYGTGLDVVAPGSLYTTNNSGTYSTASGTSISTPYVTGLASLVWTINPKLTNVQIYDLIRKGASGGGSIINSELGYGIINIAKTLELTGGKTAPVETIIPKYSSPPVLKLFGQQELTLYVGDNYIEAGFQALDCFNNDITSSVKIINNVNFSLPGVYNISYEVSDAGNNSVKASRTIFVQESLEKIQNEILEENTFTEQYINYDATSFIIEPLVGNRNNFTGSVGYEFEVVSNMTVYAVGRPVSGAMNSSHKVYIWDVKTKNLLGSAEVKPSSCIDNKGFKVAELDHPIQLQAGDICRIVSSETNGGDKWICVLEDASLKPTNDAKVIVPVYTDEASNTKYPLNSYGIEGTKGYVGVTFYYSKEPDFIVDTTKPKLILFGLGIIDMYIGEVYTEPGFQSIDDIDGDITDLVTIQSELNASVVGEYTITYSSVDKAGNTTLITRLVRVNELIEEVVEIAPIFVPEPTTAPAIMVPPEQQPESNIEQEQVVQPVIRYAPSISLIGSEVIRLNLGSSTQYFEQGVKAWDDVDGDLSTSAVILKNDLNRNEPGNYFVTYEVTNSAGQSSTITRGIQIVAPSYKVEQQPTTAFETPGLKVGDKAYECVIDVKDETASFTIEPPSKTTARIQILNEKREIQNVFSAEKLTVKEWKLPRGKYYVLCDITAGNGKCSFKVTITYKENKIAFFGDPENPLDSEIYTKWLTNQQQGMFTLILMYSIVTLVLASVICFAVILKRAKQVKRVH